MNRLIRISQLLAGSCMIAMPVAAYAQSTAANPAATAADPAQTDALVDIVVTAQRRSESLQKVPITVSAINSTQLASAGIAGSVDLGQVVPGLVFTKNIGSGAPYLRGVGPGPTGQPGYESPVAVYVDGVYKPNTAQSITSLSNVDRVEVLKGPQGTLFGRNSAAGVISIITKEPDFHPAVDVSAGYGSYRTVTGEFYGTTGLSDTLAANLSLYGLHQGQGWGYNPVNGQDIFKQSDYSARGKLLWTPTSDTKVVGSIAYDSNYGYQGPTQGIYPGALGPDGVTRYISRYVINQDADSYAKIRTTDADLHIEHDFGGFRINNIAGYGHLHSWLTTDADATSRVINESQPFISTETTYTEEFHVLSPSSSKLQWITGAYFLRDIIHIDETLKTTAGTDDLIMPLHTTSWAAFAQASYPIFSRTKITLGIRYSRDTKDYLYSDYNTAVPGSPLKPVAPTGCGPLTYIAGTCFGKKSWGDFSYRASIDHQLNNDVMIFASFNRGFQSGAFNVTVANAPAVNPVTVDAYEAGIKTELLDHRVRLNVSGFFYNYKNLQARANLNNAVYVFNAATSHVTGVDADFDARLAHGLTLHAAGEYLNAHYIDFPGYVNLVPRPTGGNVSIGTLDVSGDPLVRAPKFTGNIGPVYTFPVGFGDVTLNANYAYNSGFDWEPGGSLHQNAYGVFNATVSWKSPDHHWVLAVSGTNLTDATYFLKGGRSSTNDAYVPAAPRSVMGTITRKF